GNKDLEYRKYELTTREWNVLDDLAYVLKIFKDATLYFSNDQTSTISKVIPAMDTIDDLLTTSSLPNASHAAVTPPNSRRPNIRILNPSVKAALRLAKNVMNRYYSLTDTSSVYCISMVLHPGLKLEYFRRRDWPAEWVHAA
ncbi:hypothetical protein K435DRAFT_617863, partial [Dendrothele bispora CBS 962.96]